MEESKSESVALTLELTPIHCYYCQHIDVDICENCLIYEQIIVIAIEKFKKNRLCWGCNTLSNSFICDICCNDNDVEYEYSQIRAGEHFHSVINRVCFYTRFYSSYRVIN